MSGGGSHKAALTSVALTAAQMKPQEARSAVQYFTKPIYGAGAK